ncbi:4477_t:CDS:10 [Acaulospora morrowiae]|uniref:4477_t:CDS:1 n=1 Tax=Acaulospora morrowiae TaxID=94023 RepID=A0A9N9EYN6_9GLOM|nr:4477_t:CDS:10 [Acaulospora morrowiae]
MAATIEKLIEKLTSEIDYTFLTDFFLTYRSFISPVQLCNLLILRFNWALERDEEDRRIARVRTFVAIRHWLLNYFYFDFVSCRELRSILTNYLNDLSARQSIRDSPRDQRIVQGLRKVLKRLKKLYYQKDLSPGFGKHGDRLSGDDIEDKKYFEDIDDMVVVMPQRKFGSVQLPGQYGYGTVDSGGGFFGTSMTSESQNIYPMILGNSSTSKEQSTLINRPLKKASSYSSLYSVITPGTTDSEEEENDPIVNNSNLNSSVSRREHGHEVGLSQTLQYSESSSLKHTNDQDTGFYHHRWAISLPTISSGDDDVVGGKMNTSSGVDNKESKISSKMERVIVDPLEQSEKIKEFEKRIIRLKSRSMSDIPSKKKLQDPVDNFDRNDEALVGKEPPPLPPRRRRRHTLDVSSKQPPSPSFFKSMFVKGSFPIRKLKNMVSQEKSGDNIQRKKRSLSFSEAICGIFDLFAIDHSSGVARRNSSPSYVDTSGGSQDQRPTHRSNEQESTSRPWHRKMSGTVGRLAKGLFSGERNKNSMASFSGVIPGCGTQGDNSTNRISKFGFLCATTPVEPVNMEESDSSFSWNENMNTRVIDENDQFHLDGFSYVDESVEDEFYDTTRAENFEETERQFEQWENEDVNKGISYDGGSTSLQIPTFPQNTYSKAWGVEETNKNNTHHLSESIEVENYSKDNEPEDPQIIRRLHRQGKIYDVEDVENINFSQQTSTEGDNYQSVRSQNFRTLRHLPKVHNLHSVVTLKDLENKPSKQISWDTFTSQEFGEGENVVLSSNIIGSVEETSKESIFRESEANRRVKDDKTIDPHYVSLDENSTGLSQTEMDKGRGGNGRGFVLGKILQSSKKHKPPAISIQQVETIDPNFSQGPNKRILVQTPSSMHSRMSSSTSSDLNFQNQQPYQSFILMYRSDVIARQFCLIERDLLLNVQWEELACDWVSTEIVLTRDLNDRVRVIEKFIHIAQQCLQLSNFATLAQILLGLQSSPVERLRRTWTQVRDSEMRTLKELNEYISPFGNWKVIRDTMRQVVENSTIINEVVKKSRLGTGVKKINTGCIPFLGLYLSDLVFNSAVPSFIDPAPPTPSTPSFSALIDRPQQPLVNFHKHRTTATIVKRIMAFQNLARSYTVPIEPDVYSKCAELKGVEATRLVVMDLDVEDYNSDIVSEMFNNCTSLAYEESSNHNKNNSNSLNPISSNFIDEISSRKTSLILPDGFSGLERICLTANGNLQRILSAWFNKPIEIQIIKNVSVNTTSSTLKSFDNCETVNHLDHGNDDGPILQRYDREVRLVCSNKIVCSAFSDVIVRDKKIFNLIENEGVGLGQLFRAPSFQLLRVGRDSQSWWRVYTLKIQSIECEIKEVFPCNLFETGGIDINPKC